MEKFEKNNLSIPLNILYQFLLIFCILKKKKIYLADVSKHNLNGEKRLIPLMIQNRKEWHYIAVKQLPALLKGMTVKNHVGFYCLNCLHSFRTENKLKSHKKVCENKDFCNIVMPSEDTKILEFNQYQNSDKTPFITYANLECLMEKIDGFKMILKVHQQQN